MLTTTGTSTRTIRSGGLYMKVIFSTASVTAVRWTIFGCTALPNQWQDLKLYIRNQN